MHRHFEKADTDMKLLDWYLGLFLAVALLLLLGIEFLYPPYDWLYQVCDKGFFWP